MAGYYDLVAASSAKAVKLDPSQSEGWINTANSFYFLGRYQESLDAYNTVIASDPLNANAILGKGKVLMLSIAHKKLMLPWRRLDCRALKIRSLGGKMCRAEQPRLH